MQCCSLNSTAETELLNNLLLWYCNVKSLYNTTIRIQKSNHIPLGLLRI